MNRTDLSPELRMRVHTIINRLCLVSNGTTTNFDPSKGSSTKPTDKFPPGFNEDRSDRPDPDERMLDWFLWELDRARTLLRVEVLCIEADYRYENLLGRGREFREAGAVNVSPTVSYKDRDKRIATEYVGWPAEAVASIETLKFGGMVTAANVRRVRQLKERDPETGDLAPKLEPEERDKRLLVMADAGVSKRRMAKAFGVSPTTVTKWLERLGR